MATSMRSGARAAPWVRVAIVFALAQPAGGARAATFRVGGDACDFTGIQAAIDAAAAIPGEDTIRVATNASYTGQALKINGQALVISGGYDSCAAAAPTPGAQTVISGAGGTADSVLEFDGIGSLRLDSLRISDGDETANGHGGGIDFSGGGLLLLSHVIVSGNRAGYGGGIAFNGDSAELVLRSDVVVQNNLAVNSGGGIRVSGFARLTMVSDRSTVTGNEAQGTAPDSGYGGGIQVVVPATTVIGSPGYVNFGAVAFNRARYGGGIAVTVSGDTVDDHGYALLFTTDPQRPVRVHGNIASVAGGGLFANAKADTFPVGRSTTALCAHEFRIDHNEAPDGAAVFLDSDDNLQDAPTGARLILNLPDQSFPPDCQVEELPPSGIATSCAAGVPCNSIDSNVVRQANGQPADGAVIEMKERTRLVARRVAFIDNTATDVLHGLTTLDFRLYDCLIAGNTLGTRAVATDGPARIENCTIAGNTLGLSDVLGLTGAVALRDSIVWQPGHTTLGAARDALEGGYVLTNDPASVAPLVATDRAPRFVDPVRGDYRLRAASPAVDFAPARGGDDLLGASRDRDLANVDAHGRRDLGAYERQNLAPLVLNAGFDVDLAHWSDVTAGVSAFDATENAPGTPAGGAMDFNWQNTPVAQGRVVSRAQCIHLPAPGTYKLNGFARTTGGTAVSGQAARLHWDLRHDGTEACSSGAVDAQGDLGITGGTAWTSAATPASIILEPGDWTPDSSITVSTVMVATGVTFPPAMRGWFDGISLTLSPGDVFADGFE